MSRRGEASIEAANGEDFAGDGLAFDPDRVSARELPSFLAESRGLERDLLGEIARSRRMAWRVAVLMTIIGVAGLGAGAAGLWQPPPPPLVLRVDHATGAVEQVTALQSEASYGEVVDAYWVNRYVLDRETYDWHTIQSTYDATALLSSPEVQREYQKLYDGAGARDKALGESVRISVTMRSIQPTGKGQAVARFATRQTNANGAEEPPRNWIATIAYAYVSAPMRAEDRRVNPLGFQVTSYRVDPESVLAGEGVKP